MHAPTRQTSALAVVSLVMGICGWCVVPVIGSLVAIVTGHLARAEIARNRETLDGDGLAVAGLVLGWLMVGAIVLGLAAFILFFGGLAWLVHMNT